MNVLDSCLVRLITLISLQVAIAENVVEGYCLLYLACYPR